MKDYSTSNFSFLKVEEQLRLQGIKNSDFMLELIDEDLVGIDPYDSTLSDELKQKIITESNNNIWYYFRELLKIKNYNGDFIPFKLTKLTATMIYLYHNNSHQYINAHKESYKNIIDFLKLYDKSKNIIHIDKSEFISDNVYDIYIDNNIEDNTLLIFTSIINDKDYNGHCDLINIASVWNDKCFDLSIDELSHFYYIYYRYKL